MNIGKLYTYPHERGLYKDEDRQNWCCDIEANEPFVILEISTKTSLIISLTTYVYKVLTAKGIVGWIVGVPKNFQEVIE